VHWQGFAPQVTDGVPCHDVMIPVLVPQPAGSVSSWWTGQLANVTPKLPQGSCLEIPGRQQQRQAQAAAQAAQRLQVAYLDDHLAVVVKPFGLHVYGRGVGHLKHWLQYVVPVSRAGE
jgi:hypothetical protein